MPKQLSMEHIISDLASFSQGTSGRPPIASGWWPGRLRWTCEMPHRHRPQHSVKTSWQWVRSFQRTWEWRAIGSQSKVACETWDNTIHWWMCMPKRAMKKYMYADLCVDINPPGPLHKSTYISEWIWKSVSMLSCSFPETKAVVGQSNHHVVPRAHQEAPLHPCWSVPIRCTSFVLHPDVIP